MKKFYLLLALFFSVAAYAQTPLFYMSNYPRIVQPDVDDPTLKYVDFTNTKQKYDTLLNPFTGGLNNPTFFNIDVDGDGLQDLFVFDREQNENQFLVFQAAGKNSLLYRYAPQYEVNFPTNINRWVAMPDYNGDGLPDLFSMPPNGGCTTCIEAFKNTSGIDPISKKYTVSFKKVADTLFYYDSLNGKHEIDVTIASNAQFVDVRHLGHKDILAFDENLNNVQWFRNRGKGKDSLSFYFTKFCWGYFEEKIQHLYVPWNCGSAAFNGSWDPKYHKNSAHVVNSMCAMDVEPDGDMDLLLGDGLNDSLALLRNGLNQYNNHNVDTMINITQSHDEDNFPVDEPAVIHTMPTASNIDVNHDAVKDLLIAAGEPTYIDSFSNARMHNIWYYDNVGDTTTPVNIFKLSTKDFLQNTMVDWGINSAPCFIDVNKDGHKDLLIAVKDGGNGSQKDKGYSHLVLYMYTPGSGPGSKPAYVYQTNDYLGFSSLLAPIEWPIPAAYKNGKDGKTDLIFGDDSGRVMYFKDRSSGGSADFQLAKSSLRYLSGGQLKPIIVGRNSAPTAYDINKDGKMDLLIGSNSGAISYYRCQGYEPGSDNVPYFVLVTKTFGNLNTTIGQDAQTAPCVADLDKDGKPDLIIGDEYGNLLYYHDFDTVGTLTTDSTCLAYNYGTGQRWAKGKLFSTYTIPAVDYIDQDTMPDLMVGCRRGGLFFLGSNKNPVEQLRNSGIDESVIWANMTMRMFPNPTKEDFTLRYDNVGETRHATVILTNIVGKQVVNHPFVLENGTGNEAVNTNALSNGIYIVSVVADGQLVYSDRLVVLK